MLECTRAKAQLCRCSPHSRHPCHVPAHAGRMSRLLAPGSLVRRRRQGRRSRSTRRQGRRVPHSVSQPMPPQSRSEHGIAPRRHGLSNSVAPAARKRSASAATGASVPLSPLAPLRARSGRSRSLRGHCAGSASPLSGSCSAGEEKDEKCSHRSQPRLTQGPHAHAAEFSLGEKEVPQPTRAHARPVRCSPPFFSCREERAATAPGYRAPRTPSRLSVCREGRPRAYPLSTSSIIA